MQKQSSNGFFKESAMRNFAELDKMTSVPESLF